MTQDPRFFAALSRELRDRARALKNPDGARNLGDFLGGRFGGMSPEQIVEMAFREAAPSYTSVGRKVLEHPPIDTWTLFGGAVEQGGNFAIVVHAVQRAGLADLLSERHPELANALRRPVPEGHVRSMLATWSTTMIRELPVAAIEDGDEAIRRALRGMSSASEPLNVSGTFEGSAETIGDTAVDRAIEASRATILSVAAQAAKMHLAGNADFASNNAVLRIDARSPREPTTVQLATRASLAHPMQHAGDADLANSELSQDQMLALVLTAVERRLVILNLKDLQPTENAQGS